MGLVQNLNKRLNRLVDKILAELSYLYIRQLEKQTTKKQNNSLAEMSSQNLLGMEHQHFTTATSSQDILEKTTLNSTDSIVKHIRDWSIDRLEKVVTIGQKDAIYKEFEEWIELQDEEECDIISLDFNNQN